MNQQFTQSLKKILIILCFPAFFSGCAYFNRVSEYKSQVRAMTFTEIDLSSIPDGTYKGQCDADFIYASVSVTVKNHVISQVELLEHRHDRGKKAEVIPSRIVSSQKIDVDTVTGATNSCKVIKKAVEKALSL